RGHPPRHHARAHEDQPGVPPGPQEGRLRDTRSPQGGAQEVRTARRARPLPVLEAVVFSRRLPWPETPNALSRLLTARRAAGAPVIDLTESNPPRVGLPYPADLLRPLADPAGLRYEPAARGWAAARAAIATEAGVSADDVILTASSSESYAL